MIFLVAKKNVFYEVTPKDIMDKLDKMDRNLVEFQESNQAAHSKIMERIELEVNKGNVCIIESKAEHAKLRAEANQLKVLFGGLIATVVLVAGYFWSLIQRLF